MYCPNCGTKLPDIAKFCTKCGRPMPKRSEPPQEAASETPRHGKLPSVTSVPADMTLSNVESPRTMVPESKEKVQIPNEQPRVLVLKVPLDLSGLSGREDLYMIGVGTLVVLVAFFLSWFHIESQIANMFLGGLAALDFSGATILGGFPDLGIPGNPIVAVIPLLALSMLAISTLGYLKLTIIGQGLRVVQIALAVLGLLLMIALWSLNQAVIDDMFQQFGIPSFVGEKIYSFEPAIGFWLTVLGFVLGLGGMRWSWRRSKI